MDGDNPIPMHPDSSGRCGEHLIFLTFLYADHISSETRAAQIKITPYIQEQRT